jgi:hypothetical protein
MILSKVADLSATHATKFKTLTEIAPFLQCVRAGNSTFSGPSLLAVVFAFVNVVVLPLLDAAHLFFWVGCVASAVSLAVTLPALVRPSIRRRLQWTEFRKGFDYAALRAALLRPGRLSVFLRTDLSYRFATWMRSTVRCTTKPCHVFRMGFVPFMVGRFNAILHALATGALFSVRGGSVISKDVKRLLEAASTAAFVTRNELFQPRGLALPRSLLLFSFLPAIAAYLHAATTLRSLPVTSLGRVNEFRHWLNNGAFRTRLAGFGMSRCIQFFEAASSFGVPQIVFTLFSRITLHPVRSLRATLASHVASSCSAESGRVVPEHPSSCDTRGTAQAISAYPFLEVFA